MKKITHHLAAATALAALAFPLPAAALFCDAAILPDMSILTRTDFPANQIMAVAENGPSSYIETPVGFEACLRSITIDGSSSLTESAREAASKYLTDRLGPAKPSTEPKCVASMSAHKWTGKIPTVAGSRPNAIIGLGACLGKQCHSTTFFAKAMPSSLQLLMMTNIVISHPKHAGRKCVISSEELS